VGSAERCDAAGAIAIQVRGAPERAATSALLLTRRRLQRVADEGPWAAELRQRGIPESRTSAPSRRTTGPALWFDAADSPWSCSTGVLTSLVDDDLRRGQRRDRHQPTAVAAGGFRPAAARDPQRGDASALPRPTDAGNGVEGVVPASWLDVAFDWLRERVPDLEELAVMDLLVDAATDLADARRFLERARERAHIRRSYWRAGRTARRR